MSKKQNKNIYMGPNSTAKLPVDGIVDTELEVLSNCYALAFDTSNPIMLTRAPGVFDPTTEREIRGRFSILKLICRKYCPQKLNVIQLLENLSIDNYKGRLPDRDYLQKVEQICLKEGIPLNHMAFVRHQIMEAEKINLHPRQKIKPQKGRLDPLKQSVRSLFGPRRQPQNPPQARAVVEDPMKQMMNSIFGPPIRQRKQNPRRLR